MMEWPNFNDNGDLPVGVQKATLNEVVNYFGVGSLQRRVVAQRLMRIYDLASGTGHPAHFIIFGSFVTAKPDPNDVDIFLLMEDSFVPREVSGEAAIVFDHLAAQEYEGAGVFRLKKSGAIGGGQMALEDWQIKRDKTRRGIVEVTGRD
jgi:Family of unknown function (DUF6932)